MHIYQTLLAAGFSQDGFENFVSCIVEKTSIDEPIQHFTDGICSWENCAIGLYIKQLGVKVNYIETDLECFLTEHLGEELSEFLCYANEDDTYGDLLELISHLQ